MLQKQIVAFYYSLLTLTKIATHTKMSFYILRQHAAISNYFVQCNVPTHAVNDITIIVPDLLEIYLPSQF